MIKKILLTLGILTIGLVNFSLADYLPGGIINKGETVIICNESNYCVPIENGLTDIGNFYNSAILSLWSNSFGNYAHGVFFHDNKIYFYHVIANYQVSQQGYMTNWKVCNVSENDFNNANAINCIGDYDTPIDLTQLNQIDKIYLRDFVINHVNMPGTLCMLDESQNKSFCVVCQYGNCPSGYTPGNLINSTNYYDENVIFELGEDLFSNSGGGDSGLVDLSYKYTNQEVFDAYGEAGYYRSMCFSDFSLSDLTESSGGFFQFEPDLVDGVYYTGSTIIDLYNFYSGSRSFDNFFNHWYNLYKYSLNINSVNSFVGYSKGLWRIGYKYYMAGLGSSSMNYMNYYDYCNCFAIMDLSVSGNEIYNCGSVPLEVENNFNKGNDYGSGVLGNLTGEDLQTPDEFFDNLTNSFNTLLDSDYGSYSGIIPVYILIALMGLIFIRMISH